MNINAAQTAYQGMQNSFQKMAANTQEIIQPDATNTASELIDLKKNANQVQTLAKVIKTEDNMLGSLLDVWA